MIISPIEHFEKWLEEELKSTQVNISTACCLSTYGLDGFPNARFVSFKDILENGFVITGPLDSRKGREIEHNNKVALTFWWTATERQVRVQGNATKITEKLADGFFSARSRKSQIVSIISRQGHELENIEMLTKKYGEFKFNSKNKQLERPKSWGGYVINPIRIEFLDFKPTRFHDRKLYELINDNWTVRQIQP